MGKLPEVAKDQHHPSLRTRPTALDICQYRLDLIQLMCILNTA